MFPPLSTSPIIAQKMVASRANQKKFAPVKRKGKKEKKKDLQPLYNCSSIAYHTNTTLVSLLCPSFHTISMLLLPLACSSFPRVFLPHTCEHIPSPIPFSAFLLAVCISSRCFAGTMAATRVSQFQPRNGIVASRYKRSGPRPSLNPRHPEENVFIYRVWDGSSNRFIRGERISKEPNFCNG